MSKPTFERNIVRREGDADPVDILRYLRAFLENGGIDDSILRSNLGLFLTASNLTKVLFIADVYSRIIDVPGSIYEFGCHLGQNLVLFENLRAINEPFNRQRRFVGFDMFALDSGYPSRSDIDGESPEIVGDSYTLPEDYPDRLKSLFAFHQDLSVTPGESRLTLRKGNAMETVLEHLNDNPGEAIALGYFDLATYVPTKAILDAIDERVVPGTVLVADEFNFGSYQGASKAFLEYLGHRKCKVEKSRVMTDRALFTVL
tara:strand:- start:10703 stop:11479 length:777 start_codon:yes stop_codon:yes gene_type:complete